MLAIRQQMSLVLPVAGLASDNLALPILKAPMLPFSHTIIIPVCGPMHKEVRSSWDSWVLYQDANLGTCLLLRP